jgi:hypothetical protein
MDEHVRGFFLHPYAPFHTAPLMPQQRFVFASSPLRELSIDVRFGNVCASRRADRWDNARRVDQQKSFEPYRGNSKDITIITFDELLAKPKLLQDFLVSHSSEAR